MKYVLDILYSIVFLLLLPKLLFRRFTQERYKDGWGNRFGKIEKRNANKRTIWIHAVSVGEVNATRTIISSLTKTFPQYEIVLSTTTDTGFARANQLYGENLSVFFFPMDFSLIMRRAFKRLDPAICLLMELEVWPNFATIANEFGAEVIVVNGRLSERSFPRYKLVRFATKWMFGKVTMFLSQSEEYSQRFRALGVPDERIINTGTIKYDTAELSDKIEGKEILKKELSLGDESFWVCGGTGPGEEEIILEVYSKLLANDATANLRLAIIPRKPERFNDVANIITDKGFELQRYSEIKGKKDIDINRKAVILGDTMGDLRKFYALSSCVFVGRTLTPMGGSDMMESTAMGKFTTFGPHTFNFKQTVEALLSGNGAVEVKDAQELFVQINKAIQDRDYRNSIAINGQNVIKNNQGATTKTLEVISKFLNSN